LKKKKKMPIDWSYQQHAEERNEADLAAAVGGYATRGSAPVDVVITREGAPAHGIELKTLVTQGNDKITMKTHAMSRKIAWAEDCGASLHTVVFDDRNALDDPRQRLVYHRHGLGSFRIGNMTLLERGLQELAELLDTD
jgi:hypothetical protein